MIEYNASYLRTTSHTTTVVAPNRRAAEQMLRRKLQKAATFKLVSLQPADQLTRPANIDDVLTAIVATPYLPYQKRNATLRDWLLAARGAWPIERKFINQTLAPAGLRIVDQGVSIATGCTFPFWATHFENTKFGDGFWGTQLVQHPDTQSTHMTFAGVKSRAAIVPWDLMESFLKGEGNNVTREPIFRHCAA